MKRVDPEAGHEPLDIGEGNQLLLPDQEDDDKRQWLAVNEDTDDDKPQWPLDSVDMVAGSYRRQPVDDEGEEGELLVAVVDSSNIFDDTEPGFTENFLDDDEDGIHTLLKLRPTLADSGERCHSTKRISTIDKLVDDDHWSFKWSQQVTMVTPSSFSYWSNHWSLI